MKIKKNIFNFRNSSIGCVAAFSADVDVRMRFPDTPWGGGGLEEK